MLTDWLFPFIYIIIIFDLDDYYTEPSKKVESVLAGRLKNVQKMYPWNSNFLVSSIQYKVMR